MASFHLEHYCALFLFFPSLFFSIPFPNTFHFLSPSNLHQFIFEDEMSPMVIIVGEIGFESFFVFDNFPSDILEILSFVYVEMSIRSAESVSI